MITEQDWQQAKEEFRNDAYKRFYITCYEDIDGVGLNYEFECNFQIDSCSEFEEIKTKPLPELFAHDVEVYGENAYLMWQWRYVNGSNDWTDCNKKLSFNPDKEYRRKVSAALPFDLDRANQADVVEQRYFPFGNWESIETYENWYLLFNNTQAAAKHKSSNHLEYLRMKYPPKVKK